MFNLGQNQELYINRKSEHGLYLVENRITGDFGGKRNIKTEEILLPQGEIPDNYEIGDKIRVFIYRDSMDRLIATAKDPYIHLHEVRLLKVVSVAKIGAFVDWGLPKDLLLPFKEQTKKVSEGEEVLVALYIDKSSRLCLTMNVYDYLCAESPYKKDDHVTGRVYQISERFGAFVAIEDYYSALIPAKEVMPDIKIGRTVEARVVSVREDGKLTISVRQKAYLQMDDDARHVLDVIDSFDGVLPFSDSASPEVIKRELGMSKNAFKRAVGRLYKERKVSIEERCIRKI